jgi:hypothetical protein
MRISRSGRPILRKASPISVRVIPARDGGEAVASCEKVISFPGRKPSVSLGGGGALAPPLFTCAFWRGFSRGRNGAEPFARNPERRSQLAGGASSGKGLGFAPVRPDSSEWPSRRSQSARARVRRRRRRVVSGNQSVHVQLGSSLTSGSTRLEISIFSGELVRLLGCAVNGKAEALDQMGVIDNNPCILLVQCLGVRAQLVQVIAS